MSRLSPALLLAMGSNVVVRGTVVPNESAGLASKVHGRATLTGVGRGELWLGEPGWSQRSARRARQAGKKRPGR